MSIWEGAATMTAGETKEITGQQLEAVILDIVMPTRSRPDELTIWLREGRLPIPPEIELFRFGEISLEVEDKPAVVTRMVMPEPPNQQLRRFVTRLAWLTGVKSGVVHPWGLIIQCSSLPDKRTWLVQDIVALIAELFGGERTINTERMEGYIVSLHPNDT